MANQTPKPAMLWDALADGQVQCRLCNFGCRIGPGKRGHCLVRQNIQGKLYSLNYHAVCSVNVDPIEKKPLFHFHPGSLSLSYAAVGCNFRCEFCQNWQISQQSHLGEQISGQDYSPGELVEAALKNNCASISHTYTEPTVYFELAYETAKLAHEKGLANVFVSNGYMSKEAIDKIEPYLDAINVDLKSFSDDFYRQRTSARLQGVLDTLRYIAKETDIWLEVTTLVIPQANDSVGELTRLAQFIADELGTEVPWHVSRFHPDYQATDLPATPVEKVHQARKIGQDAGLRYVYCGNIPSDASESTYCHNCQKVLIARDYYTIKANHLRNGQCPDCKEPLPGKW